MLPLPGTENILVVDDDNAVLRLTKSMLTLHGYTVIGAASGREALQLFAVEPEIIVDLMLVDIVMPGMNGPELVDRLWKLRPGLPALYCSGYSGKEFLWPEIARNVPYLAKPFTAFQLTKRIREVLEKSSGGSATSMRSGAART
jgi:CheY-like chemotaxis protein